MKNETNECISAAGCDFPTRNPYTSNDNYDVQVSCDCFEPTRRINTTLSNNHANEFFILNGEFGC